MLAIVPTRLMELYQAADLVGHTFCLKHFQIYPYFDDPLPRFENQIILYNFEYVQISKATKLIPLPQEVDRLFPYFPVVTSFYDILMDRTKRNILVGNLFYLLLFKTKTKNLI